MNNNSELEIKWGEPLYYYDHRVLRETTPLRSLEHVKWLEQASAATSIFQVSGALVHTESISELLQHIRPPYKVKEPADLALPGSDEFYAKFVTPVTQVDPSTGAEYMTEDQLEARMRVYRLLKPTCIVLNAMIGGVAPEKIEDKWFDHTIKTLDALAEEVRVGNIEL